MDTKTLRSKTEKTLQKELADAREQLKKLEFNISSNQLRNVRGVRDIKKTIARILTILKEKAQEASSTPIEK